MSALEIFFAKRKAAAETAKSRAEARKKVKATLEVEKRERAGRTGAARARRDQAEKDLMTAALLVAASEGVKAGRNQRDQERRREQDLLDRGAERGRRAAAQLHEAQEDGRRRGEASAQKAHEEHSNGQRDAMDATRQIAQVLNGRNGKK